MYDQTAFPLFTLPFEGSLSRERHTHTNPRMLLAIIRVYGAPPGSEGLLAETFSFFLPVPLFS